MIQGLRHGLKKFWSEVFSGDLLILSLSIVLAVTSLSSVSFLGDRLQTSLKLQASSILGADLVLRSASKIDSQYIDLGQVNDLKTAQENKYQKLIDLLQVNMASLFLQSVFHWHLKGHQSKAIIFLHSGPCEVLLALRIILPFGARV